MMAKPRYNEIGQAVCELQIQHLKTGKGLNFKFVSYGGDDREKMLKSHSSTIAGKLMNVQTLFCCVQQLMFCTGASKYEKFRQFI